MPLLPLILLLGLAAGCRPEAGTESGAGPGPGAATAPADPLPGAAPLPDPCAVVDLQQGYVCIADPAAPGGLRIEPAS